MPRALSFVIHCPDRHLSYDGTTPSTKGVGGGVTARIRLAEALVRAGHRVEMICNAPDAVTVSGVTYIPLTQAGPRSCDVLIAMSTGGALDITDVARAGHRAALVMCWVQGYARIAGMAEMSPVSVVCCSNFVRGVATATWGLAPERLAVLHNGVDRALFSMPVDRDPHLLLYTSHPSKGLEAAKAVLRRLRVHDPRFRLAVCGGPGLWGHEERDLGREPGVDYLGLLGQDALAEHYGRASFSLHLQQFEEPFGIALAEAQAAGCVPVASAVGAYPELVRDGYSGWLVHGDADDDGVHARAAEQVLATVASPGLREHLVRHCPDGVLEWDVLARAWEGFCLHLLGDEAAPQPLSAAGCAADGGPLLPLADGYHCLQCGRLQDRLA